MSAKRSRAHSGASLAVRRARRTRRQRVPVSSERLRERILAKTSSSANEYLCAIEKTQNGKYNVRVRAAFGRGAWALPVYFLASSFNGAMKKLEESFRILPKDEKGPS